MNWRRTGLLAAAVFTLLSQRFMSHFPQVRGITVGLLIQIQRILRDDAVWPQSMEEEEHIGAASVLPCVLYLGEYGSHVKYHTTHNTLSNLNMYCKSTTLKFFCFNRSCKPTRKKDVLLGIHKLGQMSWLCSKTNTKKLNVWIFNSFIFNFNFILLYWLKSTTLTLIEIAM